MKTKRVCVYLRVSTADQNTSIQKQDLEDYVAARGWKITHLYEDKLSGTNTNRPSYQQMMIAARQRQFDILIVWKLDRIFRSLKDCLNGLQEISGLGIDFISLRDNGIDLTTPSGKLLLHLLAAFAEFEASLIKSRVTAGVRAKIAKTGRWGPTKKRNDGLIRALREKGHTVRDIAKRTGVSPASVIRALK
jgi:DNA invertase Pin-like site-specific DNA recombinase